MNLAKANQNALYQSHNELRRNEEEKKALVNNSFGTELQSENNDRMQWTQQNNNDAR